MLWLQPFHEGINLTEAHLALTYFQLDVATVILLNLRSHTTLLDIVDDSRNRVLHEQLYKHVLQVDCLALLSTSIEAI